MQQAGIYGIAISWKPAQIGYYQIGVPILTVLSIFFLVKDFLAFRKIEQNMVQAILKGLELEKKSSDSDHYFHDVVQSFKLMTILIQRSVINGAALWCLGYWISLVVADIRPDLVINYRLLNLSVCLFTALSCTLYYESLKNLAKAKREILPD